MTDRIRYESKKAFAKTKDVGLGSDLRMVELVRFLARRAAENDFKRLLDKRKNADKDNDQPNSLKP